MEFKQAVGLRRSVRIWRPWQPVEQAKLQTILEAIYRAPRVLEVDFIRVVVMDKDAVGEEQLELPPPHDDGADRTLPHLHLDLRRPR